MLVSKKAKGCAQGKKEHESQNNNNQWPLTLNVKTSEPGTAEQLPNDAGS